MFRVLFVCHGNICRSPMAELVLRDMAAKQGCSGAFEIASRATSAEELGNPVYPPARRVLARHGISCEGKYAVQLQPDDYDRYDYIIGMDSANLRNMRRLFGGDPAGKLSLLNEWSGRGGDVADPWYSGDFEATWRDVEAGCVALLAALTAEEKGRRHSFGT